MKGLQSVFSSLGSGIRRLGSGAGLKSKRVFNAYDAKEYDTVYSLVADMSPSTFIKEIKREDVSLLHQCVADDNIDAL